MSPPTLGSVGSTHRPPAVAGAFYPAAPQRLRELVASQLAEAVRRSASSATSRPDLGSPLGILVPHAGLQYSGIVAATAWRLIGAAGAPEGPPTIVVLGTNHRAAWLDGIGIWDRGAWHTPIGDVPVDAHLAAEIAALGPPFVADREAHLEEHSIEVQLPFVRTVSTDASIVPLAVSTGIGPPAVEAGRRLGELLLTRRVSDPRLVIVISSDMAHYPSATDAAAVTSLLLPAITHLDPADLAAREVSLRERAAMGRGLRSLACGMCGIEPTVVGLAALHALGASRGTVLASATSADAGGPPDRTVGYLAARFD
ncbi:MAG TPA: AmmeMemoRadiSam system protein B [Candidatus Limnocylindrales bacterium]|nr:AmmeMemoRadiSam system protein B [Candidatus Limnocylindrales bacterium]